MGKVVSKPTPFAGFTRATVADYSKQRIIGLSIGEVGSRKTSFWLEGPGPIAIFGLDQGLEGVVNKILEESPKKEIHVWEKEWYPNKDEDLQERAVELRDEFLKFYEEVLPHVRTVIIDKEGDLWNLFRYAEFGPEAKGQPKDFDALNMRYRKWINMAKATDINLGLIQGMKDAWGMKTKNNGAQGLSKLGERVPVGFGEAAGLVHVNLAHTGTGPDTWSIQVGKVRGPGTLQVAGNEYSFSDVPNFSTFAQMVFPDSEPEYWE